MKKYLVSLLMVSIIACNNSSKDETKDKKETTDITKNPDYQKGLALVTSSSNTCLTCHSIESAVTGPSYRDVANRYANYPDTIVPHLARKIIAGGKGVWGEVWMTPNSAVSQEDAEAMVKYILLLKK